NLNHKDFKTAYMPSDRVLVVTSEKGDKLETLVGSDGSSPVLPVQVVSLVRRAQKGQAWIVFPFDQTIKQLMELGLAQVPLPPEKQPVVKAVTEAGGVAVHFGIDQRNVKLAVTLGCAKGEDAKLVADELDGLWKQFKPLVDQSIAEMLKDPEVPRE